MNGGQFRWLPSLRELDEDQLEVIHNSLNKGGNLIYGPAGCGKTAIILYCAKTLQDTGKNYLVFIYTKVLAKFIEAALNDLEIPTNKVHRFYKWVYRQHRDKIGSPPDCDNDDEKYSMWVDNLIHYFEKNPGDIPRYDFILIDEAQDFDANVSKLLHMISENIFIAGDTAQSIYTDITEFEEFKRVWQPIRKNYRLLYNYRNPRTVANLAALFLDSSSLSKEEFLKTVKGRDHEMQPVWLTVESDYEQTEKIVQIIKDSRGADRIGILCFNHQQAKGLHSDLKQRNINAQLALGENGYLFSNPLPVITTIHSSKGLEFDWVIVPFLNSEVWDKTDHHTNKERLFFVALTRTKNRLYLISQQGKECSLVRKVLETDPSLIQTPRKTSSRSSQMAAHFDDDPF